jgi:hypothetical protein
VTGELIAEWQRKHPGEHWQMAQADTGAFPSPAPAKAGAMPSPCACGGRETFVDEGNKIFHSAKRLGGTIGASCDMCYPNAANTHPETHPNIRSNFSVWRYSAT